MRLTILSLVLLSTTLAAVPARAAEDLLRPGAYAELAFGGNKPIGDFRLGLRLDATERFYDSMLGDSLDGRLGRPIRALAPRQAPALLQWEVTRQAISWSAAGIRLASLPFDADAEHLTAAHADGSEERRQRIATGVTVGAVATVAVGAAAVYALDQMFDGLGGFFDDFFDCWFSCSSSSGGNGGSGNDSDYGSGGDDPGDDPSEEPCTVELSVAGLCV